ncbi:MAG: hypothetical protein PVJ86_07290, partial [Phycisphaerales bacterium]
KFSSPGEYEVGLKVQDDEDNWSGKEECTVRIVVVGLGVSTGYVAVNNDDDNANEKPDYHSTEQTVTGENDLVAIYPSVTPSNNWPDCNVRLSVFDPYKACVKIWSSQNKSGLVIPDGANYHKDYAPSSLPSTLYVEGISSTPPGGTVSIALVYQAPNCGDVDQDQVDLIVLEVDLDMDGVDDNSIKTEEITPGGFIALNQDDDDNNESEDKGQSGPITGEDNLVIITLNKVSPTDLTGHVTLTASTKVKIWGSATKGASPITLPVTYATPSDLPKYLWLEGFDNSSSVRDAGLALEYSKGGTTFDDIIKLTVVKVDVEVAGNDDDTEEIPSVKPASKVPDDHFVTAKGSGNIGLWATTVPDDIEVHETISWTGITQHPEENLYAFKSRASSGKFANVRVNVCGRDAKDVTNWVVWSSYTSSGGTPSSVSVGSTFTQVSLSSKRYFYFTISPSTIIDDSDRPELSTGAPASPPDVPAGETTVAHCGIGLGGGVNAKWDESRQRRHKLINPDSISFANSFYNCGCGCGQQFWENWLEYPQDKSFTDSDVTGNDDRGTADEDNDPYDAVDHGKVRGRDQPTPSIRHAEGAVGNTVDLRLHFLEFARLELGGSWYQISAYEPWRLHAKLKKADEAVDNIDYNSDGDKLDKVWIDDGSSTATDNSGW